MVSTNGTENQTSWTLPYDTAGIAIDNNIIVYKTLDDDVFIQWRLENGSRIDKIGGLEGAVSVAYIYPNAARVLLKTEQKFYVVDFGTDEAVQITGLSVKAEVLAINYHLTTQFYFTKGNLIYFVKKAAYKASCLNCAMHTN